VFLTVSTLIGVFKREKDNRLEDNYVHLNVVQNYKLLWDILKLPSIRILLIALLTMRVNAIILSRLLENFRRVFFSFFFKEHILSFTPDNNAHTHVRCESINSVFISQVGFSTTRVGLVNLKLVDAGVPKDGIMILTTATFAVKILTPIAVSKYTSGPKPMSICLNTIVVRYVEQITDLPDVLVRK